MSETVEHLRNASALHPRRRAVTVVLPEDVYQGLKDLATEHERSLAAELRWAVKQYIEESGDFVGRY